MVSQTLIASIIMYSCFYRLILTKVNLLAKETTFIKERVKAEVFPWLIGRGSADVKPMYK